MTNETHKQAQHWCVRLQSPEVTDLEKQQHKNWLSQNSDNLKAYQQVQGELDSLSSMQDWAEDEIKRLDVSFTKKNNNLISKKDNLIAYLSCRLDWFSHSVFVQLSVLALVFIGCWSFISPSIETQIFTTSIGEQRGIVLEDGSRIQLNSNSSVEISFNANIRQINLLKGEGLFDVAHDGSRPFVVKVEGSKVVATGTRFSVYSKRDDHVTVTVLEGSVAVVSDKEALASQDITSYTDKASVLLKPNRQVQVNTKGEVAIVKVVDARQIVAWDRGLLILDETPLRQAVEEISRYVVGDIKVADEVPDFPITGVIKIRDKDNMLRLLAQVVPIMSIKKTANLTVLYSSLEQ